MSKAEKSKHLLLLVGIRVSLLLWHSQELGVEPVSGLGPKGERYASLEYADLDSLFSNVGRVAVIGLVPGFVESPCANDCGEGCENSASQADTNRPDQDVDFCSDTEHGKELGDRGDTAECQCAIHVDPVGNLPPVQRGIYYASVEVVTTFVFEEVKSGACSGNEGNQEVGELSRPWV